MTEQDQEDDVSCLTGFSSVAATAHSVATEESRTFTQVLREMADDSDDDEQEMKWGGSRPGRSANLPRDFELACEKTSGQCFSGEQSLHRLDQFKRRCRVSPATFERVFSAVNGKGKFLPAGTKDALGRQCIHPLVRLTTVFHTLACGSCAECQDENWETSQTVVDDALKSFCRLLVDEFGGTHLNWTPTEGERKRILAVNKERGFPGCFASWDCKHFVWDMCPVAKQGQHRGHSDGGKHTKTMEATADDSCWFGWINFGSPGSLNDLNVLEKSSIVGGLLSGLLHIKTDPHLLNGTTRDWMYFLNDGVYPSWAIFVKTMPKQGRKTKAEEAFLKKQEGTRKDVERAFGVLVKKFHILARPIRLWKEKETKHIICACVILHNMRVEERILEKGSHQLEDNDHLRHTDSSTDPRADATEQCCFSVRTNKQDSLREQGSGEPGVSVVAGAVPRLGHWKCQLGAGGSSQDFLARCHTDGVVAGVGSLRGVWSLVDWPVALALVDAGVECIVRHVAVACNPLLDGNATQQSLLVLVACFNWVGLRQIAALHHLGIRRPLPVACRLVAPVSAVATTSKVQRKHFLIWTLLLHTSLLPCSVDGTSFGLQPKLDKLATMVQCIEGWWEGKCMEGAQWDGYWKLPWTGTGKRRGLCL